MRIRIEQFCNLSTNNTFQRWLWAYDPDLYKELTNHLKVSKGCGSNREKMTVLIGKIEARPGGRNAVIEFLRTNFPAMLDQDNIHESSISDKQIESTVIPSDVPFLFNGVQLTFPRRIILHHPNLGVLQENLKNFIKDKLRIEYIIIGNKAYIEYVPVSHARVLNQIPEVNWQVPKFKRSHGLI